RSRSQARARAGAAARDGLGAVVADPRRFASGRAGARLSRRDGGAAGTPARAVRGAHRPVGAIARDRALTAGAAAREMDGMAGDDVTDNRAAERYELAVDGQI